MKKANRSIHDWDGAQSAIQGCSLTFALLGLFILISEHSFAGDVTLFNIGPRYGFSLNEPLLGKRQTERFNLVDVATTFSLPWSWPLGRSPWSVETRLITSAGALSAAGKTGFIAAVQPDVALTGWNNFVSINAGAGLAVLGREQYGSQDFGGPVQFGLTMALQIHPISHAFAGFRFQHFSDAGMYGSDSLSSVLTYISSRSATGSDAAHDSLPSCKKAYVRSGANPGSLGGSVEQFNTILLNRIAPFLGLPQF